jgi:hypothetical protein
MGPSEDRSTGEKNQAGHFRMAGKRRRIRRARSRACLLKGCERRFRPLHPLRRYCSEQCREEARRWREWKARHHYRQSEGGKQKRRAQSRRYQLRSKRARAANPGPRRPREGHRKKNILPLLRSPWLLCRIPLQSTFSPAAILFALLLARPGAGSRARTALAGTTTRAGMEISAAILADTIPAQPDGNGPEILRFLRLCEYVRHGQAKEEGGTKPGR